MNIEKVDEKENPLLLRKEINFKITYDKEKSPSKEEVKKLLINTLKCDENLIVLNKINQIFGKNEARVNLYLYNNIENLKKIEKKKKVKKEHAKKESKEQKNK